MQEQERIANEEAEKRLKAALTAKREPGVTASRVASPAVGNPATPESSDPKPLSADEVESSMDVDSAVIPPPPPHDVRFIIYSFVLPSWISSRVSGFLSLRHCSRTFGKLRPAMRMMSLGKDSIKRLHLVIKICL
jgi:hypothetical protein